MKIAFIGTHSVGKTTLIEQFLSKWPMYTKAESTYRDLIKQNKLKINKKGTEESQRIILNSLIDEVQNVTAKGSARVVFDRCVVDNIAYTLWLNAHKKVSDEFVDECKTIAAETLKLYDIIFYLPVHESIPLTKKSGRDSDPVYREELDNIFDALITSYEKGTGRFFPLSDCPAVIRLDMSPAARCEQIGLYIQHTGECFDEKEPSLIEPYIKQ